MSTPLYLNNEKRHFHQSHTNNLKLFNFGFMKLSSYIFIVAINIITPLSNSFLSIYFFIAVDITNLYYHAHISLTILALLAITI